MTEVNVQVILDKMLQAAKEVLKSHWEKVKPFAEQEFKAYAQNIQLIMQLKEEGKISKEQATYYLEIQKGSIRVVLLTIEGLGILAVEAAINEALSVIRTTVNKALGWSII